jgi:hypothetical protein
VGAKDSSSSNDRDDDDDSIKFNSLFQRADSTATRDNCSQHKQ